ncbi:MAG: lytic polysaccharide monooxygenase [Deltaproteobacteria bacterium]|nr:lytic polysaccharide monooxygenase [Deltaproteobacteria bacterium]
MRNVLTSLLLLFAASEATAHIHLTNPKARTDSLTGDQKDQHCGVIGQTRNPARVTTYRPGETITVTWMETINHPGHFRIAFQPSGDTFGIPPAGNGPPSGFPSLDQTGQTDGAGALILKDFIADGTLSTDITFPNMECDNCTLQFIQVMTDKPPYTVDANSDDVYFNCADITLSNAAPPAVDGAPAQPGTDAGPNGPGSADPTGGCATHGGAGGLIVAAAAALVFVRRRRAR